MLKRLFISVFSIILFLSTANAKLSCNSILDDGVQQLAEVVLKLEDINRGKEAGSDDFADFSIKTLVDAIETVSFKDIPDESLRQAKEYLLNKKLTRRETLLLSIVEFNIIELNSSAHIDAALQTLISMPVPDRRGPEFNWHLAEFYYASGNKEMAFELLLYILRSARLQPKTVVYIRNLGEELNKVFDLPLPDLVRLASLDPISPMFFYNDSDWGPYIRNN